MEMRDILHETQVFLKTNCQRLRDLYGVKSIAIFGSVARGEPTVTSDLDILSRSRQITWITVNGVDISGRG